MYVYVFRLYVKSMCSFVQCCVTLVTPVLVAMVTPYIFGEWLAATTPATPTYTNQINV